MITAGPAIDKVQSVLCFCHLRWDFVYQRPQHLLSRACKYALVHLWEEPIFGKRDKPGLHTRCSPEGVYVVTPLLPEEISQIETRDVQRNLLNEYITERGLENFITWYYTPMALQFSDHLSPLVTVYDCMDELSAFQGAPPEMIEEEQKLFSRADIVFAGGAALYASRRTQHHNVHLFPSSIDRNHFATARRSQTEPEDQLPIPFPRIGFYGVLDERLDRELLRQVAESHPEWQLVLIGPIVKIREDQLPKAANIHYLGQKAYAELPSYLSGWDAAMLPFAINASTRFISPTKTPEYLAAGKPVISTPIRDVVRPYGELGLVEIGADPDSFAKAVSKCLNVNIDAHRDRADQFLSNKSWDRTFDGMWNEIQRCVQHEFKGANRTNSEKKGGGGANV